MNPSRTTFKRTVLYVTVFCTGAAVMIIELLGTRLIAPFYGASLYVWSSLISVTMIALAAGYFAGGLWADRRGKGGLSLLVALAGLLILLIPWLIRPVLLATDSLGLRGGAFASALILFFPSLMLLGMVGPFAVKLGTSSLDGVGSSAGTLYAVSTVGSVVGTLALGFYLFPLVGSREILAGTGVMLAALAVAVGWYERGLAASNAPVMSAAALMALALALLPAILSAGHASRGGKFAVRSEHESLYGWVRVIDRPAQDLRLLSSDASAIGAAGIAANENRLSYQEIVGVLPPLSPPMKKALIIGLGAGFMSQALHDRYGMIVDTLEIDPAVLAAASDYFGFRPRGKTVIGDARYEIRHLRGPYDLIVHDCFTGGSEPAHLLTVETLRQLRGLLSDNGILAVNFVAFAGNHDNPALASVAKTLARVFPHQKTFISEPGKDFNDFIFLASRKPLDPDSALLLPEQKRWLNGRLFAVNDASGVVLTDNLNPLEQLQIRKSEHYRRMIVELVGADLLVR